MSNNRRVNNDNNTDIEINKWVIDKLKELSSRLRYGHMPKAIKIFIGSLERYPKPIGDGAEAKQLSGCGDTLSTTVQNLINEYNNLHPSNDNHSNNNNINGNGNQNISGEVQVIKQWLDLIGLSKYFQCLIDNEANSIERIKMLTIELLDKVPNLKMSFGDKLMYTKKLPLIDEIQIKYQNNQNNQNNNSGSDNQNNQQQQQQFQLNPNLKLKYIKGLCSKSVLKKANEILENRNIKANYSDEIMESTVDRKSYDDLSGIPQQPYNVALFQNESKSKITKATCDCKYSTTNSSNYCKHKIATLLLIRAFRLYDSRDEDDQELYDDESDNEDEDNKEQVQQQQQQRQNSRRVNKKTREEEQEVESEGDYTPNKKRTTKRKKNDNENNNNNQSNDSNQKTREYRPDFRSTSWSILMALNQTTQNGYLMMDELIIKAQDHTETRLSIEGRPSPHLSSAMKTLTSHALIKSDSKPKQYSLTQKGFLLVKQLSNIFNSNSQNNNNNDNNNDNNINNNKEKNERKEMDLLVMREIEQWSEDEMEKKTIKSLVDRYQPLNQEEIKKITSGNMVILDIMLLVDNRELKNRNPKSPPGNNNLHSLLSGLNATGVHHVQRTLPLGDFLWVALVQWKDDPTKAMFEIVLNVIIERKKLHDLNASVGDGRYLDQKKRLGKCGIKNIYYLIEGDNSQLIVSRNAYETSVSDTLVYDGIIPIFAESELDTIRYLTTIHELLKENTGHYLTQMCFEEFEQAQSSIPISNEDMFASWLMCIHGMTGPKAHAIVAKFPTLSSLCKRYNGELLSISEKKELLHKSITGRSFVTPEISLLIYELFQSRTYEK